MSTALVPARPAAPQVDRTGELEMELRLLRGELQHAHEARVQANAWHQQSKALAQASDDACAAFQVRATSCDSPALHNRHTGAIFERSVAC